MNKSLITISVLLASFSGSLLSLGQQPNPSATSRAKINQAGLTLMQSISAEFELGMKISKGAAHLLKTDENAAKGNLAEELRKSYEAQYEDHNQSLIETEARLHQMFIAIEQGKAPFTQRKVDELLKNHKKLKQLNKENLKSSIKLLALTPQS